MAEKPRNPAKMEALNRIAQFRTLESYVNRPTTAYGRDSGKFLEGFLKRGNKVVPKGAEVYRALSDYDVERLVPKVGSSYKPGGVTSFASPQDLQFLGEAVAGKREATTGGNTAKANALAIIRAMEDVPGIQDVNAYGKKISNLVGEGLFGPKTRFEVQGYTPASKNTPATWNLGAYANMGLGALNILGFLPMLNQGGKIMQGKEVLPEFRGGDFRG
jgi:hypothetical protein